MTDPVEQIIQATEKEVEYAQKHHPGPSDFVHLHNHTLFSALDGVATPEQYMAGCAHRGLPAFAITDHGSLACIPDAYFASKKHGVKYLVGIELYFNDYHQVVKELLEDAKAKELKETDPEMMERYRRNRHLTVIAKNMTGYHNLLAVTTKSWEDGFYYKPRVWFDRLAQHKEGLIILSGCLNGPILHELRWALYSKWLRNGKIDQIINSNDPAAAAEADRIKQRYHWLKEPAYYTNRAVYYINKFHAEFGDDYYLEFQLPGVEINNGKELYTFLYRLWKTRFPHIKAAYTNDCLTPDYPILMADGSYKPIGDVKIGDYVISHTGKSRKVTATGRRPRRINEKMWNLFNLPWSMTDNHPMILNGKRINAHNNPDYGNIVSVSLSDQDMGKFDTKKAVNAKSRTRLESGIWRTASPKTKNINIPEFLPITDEFLWVLGNYIAEGFRDKYRISFASHKKEKYIHLKIMKYFRQFGLNPDYNEKRTNSQNGAVVRVCSAIFADIMEYCAGCLAHNKHLPPFWMRLSKRQLKILLNGYLAGDGDNTNHSGFHWASTSWQLTGQLMLLISSLGGYARPYFKPKRLFETGRIDRQQYHGTSAKLSTAVINEQQYPTHHTSLEVYDPDNMQIPLKWSESSYNGEVVDIEVEKDHTFVLWGGIICSNCHYSSREDFELQKTMMAVGQGVTVDSPNLFHVNSDEQFFKTRHQMRQTWRELGYDKIIDQETFESMCDTTMEIHEKCDYFNPDLSPKLPEVPNADEELTKRVMQSLKDKGVYDSERKFTIDNREVTYREQANIELQRIIEKKFSSYFLITADFCDYSRNLDNEHDHPSWDVGPGRGSCAGSLVCYLLGIHELDPMKWGGESGGLSFDRFLSSSRGGYMLKVTME